MPSSLGVTLLVGVGGPYWPRIVMAGYHYPCTQEAGAGRGRGGTRTGSWHMAHYEYNDLGF
jgi:hypothetical protein